MKQQQSALCVAFEALEREAQMEALHREGVYIGKRKESNGTSLLYQYQTIYVQIMYAVHRLHINEIHCFSDTAILDDYLSATDFTAYEPD